MSLNRAPPVPVPPPGPQADAGGSDASASATSASHPPPSPAAAHAVDRAVAAKVLAAWLANRRQTLMPHTLNLRALSPDEIGLVIEVMAAAAQADGEIEMSERRQASLALDLIGAKPEEIARHQAALNDPQPLSRVLNGVRSTGMAAHAYAGALLAINRSSPVNQAFLAYLASRLALPTDVARALESRYRA